MKESKKTNNKEPYKIKKKPKVINHFNKNTYNNNKNPTINSSQKKEEDPLYMNTLKFKFLFFYTPKKIFQDSLGFSLTFYVRLICIIYALRASTIYNQIKNHHFLINYNFIINCICIFTSFFLYISLYKHSRKISTFAYYIYLIHFFLKLFTSAKMLLSNLQKYHYTKQALIGIILGLSTGSCINFCSTWIIFSYMIFTYNIKNKT